MGKNLAFDRLRIYLNNCKNKFTEIMWLASLLGHKQCREKDCWDKLAKKFFEEYRLDILEWCGYDQVEPLRGRVPVKDEEFLLNLIGCMKQKGWFGESSNEYLAMHLYHCFDLKNSPESICTRLKTPFSDYSFCINDFFEKIRAIERQSRKK